MQEMVDVRHGANVRRFHRHSDLVSYPEKWDWREKGFVTDVSHCDYKKATLFLIHERSY